MTVNELANNLHLTWVTNIPDKQREINGCYIGDLLSWVMSHAQADNVWITIMTNINIVAVATLTDVACIIVPEGIEVDAATVEKANQQGIAILSSEQTSYQLAKQI